MTTFDFIPASCINQGQQLHFTERAMELLRLWHEDQRKHLTKEEFNSWMHGIYFPKLLRLGEAQSQAIEDAFTGAHLIGGQPPFVIDLNHVGHADIFNPPGLNDKNSGSLLTHRWGLRGAYAELHGIEFNDVIEWQLWLAQCQARIDTFWDRFINLEAI